jgi:AraC family transcriptional regulator of adaptative response / DNA-3-methyladenine glycosylase II
VRQWGVVERDRSNRAQTARTLLTHTDLSIANVAFAAGFSSIRQFNDTVQAVYEQTPTQLRRLGTARATSEAHSLTSADPLGPGRAPITLLLPAREPFDGVGLMTFFADHAVAGMESGDESRFRRAVRLPHCVAAVELTLDNPAGVVCTARLENFADLGALVSRMWQLLDLDADSESIDAALARDPHLAPSVRAHPGVRLPGSLDAEETLLRTLIGQQISVKAARTVLGRIVTEFGQGDIDAGLGLFPTSTHLLERGREVLRGPASRIATILGVAEALASGTLTLDVNMPAEELTARLVALPGIGPWTAGYLAMRVLGNPDVLLTSDLVMRQSAKRLGLPSTARSLAEYGARWAPWRSYAGLHLWRSR